MTTITTGAPDPNAPVCSGAGQSPYHVTGTAYGIKFDQLFCWTPSQAQQAASGTDGTGNTYTSIEKISNTQFGGVVATGQGSAYSSVQQSYVAGQNIGADAVPTGPNTPVLGLSLWWWVVVAIVIFITLMVLAVVR